MQLGGGLLEWTSPTGRIYIDKPPPPNTVTFTEAEPPPDPADLIAPWAAASEELFVPF